MTVAAGRRDGRTEGFNLRQAGGHLDGWQKRTHAGHGQGCWRPGDPPPGPYWVWTLATALPSRHSDEYNEGDD